MSDLTVYSVCVGDKYPSAYVYALRDAVAEYLTIPHRFKCITTRAMPGIKTVLPFVPYQSWWSKFNLWAPTIARGPSLYFDLDVVICGNLDYLADFTEYQFAAPANWARSGHGGIQSSVMAWRGGWTAPYDKIKAEWPHSRLTKDGYRDFGDRVLWGDQEYLWDMLGDDWVRIPGVCSYKYHVKPSGKIPEDASVVVFHGDPKPIEVRDKCVLPFTVPLHKHITGNISTGLPQDSAGTG